MNKKVMIIIGVITVIAIASIVLIVISRGQSKNKTPEKITLNWWQPYDDKAAFTPLIEQYQSSHPNIQINYVHNNWQNPSEYEQEVIDSLANNEGPDIWSIKNGSLPKHYKKLAPLPENVISRDDYNKTFFPVIVDDMTIKTGGQEQIYGFPFSMDTLVLIYNNEHFRKAEIDDPPTTWDQFVADADKLTKRDGNTITQSGAALGTTYNVDHSFDIISLMMLQNGTEMVSENKKEAYFNRSDERNGKPYYPGTSALSFYADFALPQKTSYSWNNNMRSSIEEFIAGKTSMIFGYSSDLWTIKKRAPKLQFSVVPVPQVKEGDTTAYPYFWSQVVSANSKNQSTAWDFLKFCLDKENIKKYYEAKENEEQVVPSSIMDTAKNQEGRSQDVGPIVQQDKGAKDWYKGDPIKMQNVFQQMISAVIGGQGSQAAIDAAAKDATKILSEFNK